MTIRPRSEGWVRVVFADECDEDGNCPVCRIDYAECDCPGPTQEDEYEYAQDDGTLYARKRTCSGSSAKDSPKA